jgi:hypothetical protein
MFFWILLPNLRIWIQDPRAEGHVSSMVYFLKIFGRQRKEDLRLMYLQSDSSI